MLLSLTLQSKSDAAIKTINLGGGQVVQERYLRNEGDLRRVFGSGGVAESVAVEKFGDEQCGRCQYVLFVLHIILYYALNPIIPLISPRSDPQIPCFAHKNRPWVRCWSCTSGPCDFNEQKPSKSQLTPTKRKGSAAALTPSPSGSNGPASTNCLLALGSLVSLADTEKDPKRAKSFQAALKVMREELGVSVAQEASSE